MKGVGTSEPLSDKGLLHPQGKPALAIAPLAEGDLPQLMTLQAELLDEASDLDRMRELFALVLKDQNYHLLGAKKEGQLVGSLAGIVCHDLIGKCLPFMVIENVIVTKTWRHQGVGRMLMTAVEKVAQARGCRYIMLVSAITREQAPALYQSLGYESAPYRGFKKTLAPW
jgi:ribosomal protein S18 acetylase RimI-like enzyme